MEVECGKAVILNSGRMNRLAVTWMHSEKWESDCKLLVLGTLSSDGCLAAHQLSQVVDSFPL